MKIWIRYIGFFGLGIFLFVFLVSMSNNPENTIKGEWKELVWEYEKVDDNDTINKEFKTVSEYIKDNAGENLIIHKAEKWIFKPNGKLTLQGKNTSKEVNWTIKGRGNILEIKYNNNNFEYYNLTELSENKLVLNFDTENHTRGIARLTFEKIN